MPNLLKKNRFAFGVVCSGTRKAIKIYLSKTVLIMKKPYRKKAME
jgi:hypothetical protein